MAPPRRKTSTPSSRSKAKSKADLAASLFSATPPPTPKLTTLPPELQKNIADYLTSTEDMKNLCVACKDLQALITPYLYRTMVLWPVKLNDNLKTVLHSQNPGLKHTRRVSIVTCRHMPNSYVYGKIFDALCHLLYVIPRDTLETFDLSGMKEVGHDLQYLLRVRQRRLAAYQFHPLPTPNGNALPAADELTFVTTLQLFLTKLADCEPAGILLGRLPKLSKLAVELQFSALLGSDGPSRAKDTGTRVVTKLFDQLSQPTSAQVSKLKRLRISKMCFADAGRTLPTLLDCSELKHLQLIKCEDTHRLFESFAQLKLGLDSFVVDRADDQSNTRGMTDTLLRSLNPIERLRFTRAYGLDTYADFDWDAITQHGSSLRTLEIDDLEWCDKPFEGGDGDYDRSLEGFRDLCKSLTKVRQFSMRSPVVEPYHWATPAGFNEFLSCIAHMRELRTIKLYTWPNCLDENNGSSYCPECEQDGLPLQVHEAKETVRNLANMVFTTLATSCPNLGVLVFECWRSTEDDRPEECVTFAFTRSMQIDAYLRVTWVGVDIPLSQIKLHEPCSDILEEEKFLAI